MDICIDFDGTCTTHEYPMVGAEIGAVPVLKKLVKKGHKLIIFTMRSGDQLRDAYNWFMSHDIPVYGIQSNPTQIFWTQSPKAYGQLYINDAALGCPLTHKEVKVDGAAQFILANGNDTYQPSRPYVDWVKVEKMLKEKGLI